MKKIFSLLLIIAMLFSLFTGCQQEPETPVVPTVIHTLKVGYGRCEITPTEAVRLYDHTSIGHDRERVMKNVLDPIYTTCIAFSDENNETVLLFQNDLFDTDGSSAFSMIRAAVAKAVNLPTENVIVSATHTHGSPDFSDKMLIDESKKIYDNYVQFIKEQMIEAAKTAINDMTMTEIFVGSIEISGLNKNARNTLQDGTVLGASEKDADNSLQMIRLTRTTGKDIYLVNFQCHPDQAVKKDKYAVTSDYIGVMRTKIEEKLGGHFAFFNGASGNLYPHYTKTEDGTTFIDYQDMGTQLAENAIKLDGNLKKVEVGSLQLKKEAVQGMDSKGKYVADVYLYSLCMGDAVFVLAPYEMYNDDGLKIKEASKFSSTFIVTNANFSYGDVPTADRFLNGNFYGYGKAPFAKEYGEIFTDKYISMLDALYQTKT